MAPEEFTRLVRSLVALGRETEWVEFKHNNAEPQAIGENVAAVSNGAALHQKTMGYLLWGVDDKTHKIVGTTFKPRQTKKGNEELENWLLRLLQPRIDVRIKEGHVDGRDVVLLEAPPALTQPTRFSGREYIRVGSYTKPLAEFPEKERALWRLFNASAFEEGVAAEAVTSDQVLSWIDYSKYFRLMDQPLPDNRKAILEMLCAEEIITATHGERFDITNVGAILFAQRLSHFRQLERKSLRVIVYRGEDRYETIKEELVDRGYALGFEGAIRYLNDQLPQSEEIEQALRHKVRTYPEIAIRELVANALIHQDFLIRGAGPTVEVFDTRVEITNPGAPLIEPLRFIDQPPRSRNEKIAGLMRRMNICEERGTGSTKLSLRLNSTSYHRPTSARRGLTLWRCYSPRGGSAKWIEGSGCRPVINTRACNTFLADVCPTLRFASGWASRKRNYPQASKIIRESVEAGLIKPYEGGSESIRDRSYLPFWS